MSTQRKEFSFKGQKIFVGLDVHLKSWTVTVLSEQSVLKKFTQDPSPAALYKFLSNTYPGAEYYSVYEAGFADFGYIGNFTILASITLWSILQMSQRWQERE